MASSSSHPAGENLVLFLALVPFVMDRGEVSVAQAAAQFGRSQQDIKKAVELIACAGIPGDSSAYLHADLFDIDWDALEHDDVIRFENTIVIDQQPRFSPRELAALIAGLQYLAAHPRYGERGDVQGLLGKLRALTGSNGEDTLVVKSRPVDATRDLLDRAISAGKQVSFDYLTTSGEAGRRNVDPITLEARDNTWYLRGWCHTRQALRVFRLDRMATLDALASPVETHPDVGQPESWQIFDPSPADLRVVIECDGHALPLIAEYLDRHNPPEKEGDVFVATIPFAHENALMRFVCSHPGMVRVRGPESARAAVLDFAARALETPSASDNA
ncbi:MAG: WYL domain-containing protein [Pontimonas sp.]